MLKNKEKCILVSMGLALLTCMLVITFCAGARAREVQREVLRFHIVANSDTPQDQQLKLMVRDEMARLTDLLFRDATTKESAVRIAKENLDVLQAAATTVLREHGCDDAVQVQIKNLYFPTKRYENVSFPAGKYDALHITLGEGKGENYWCVMFPALCVPSVSEDNDQLLSSVLGGGAVDLVTHPYSIRFKIAEWFGYLHRLFE